MSPLASSARKTSPCSWDNTPRLRKVHSHAGVGEGSCYYGVFSLLAVGHGMGSVELLYSLPLSVKQAGLSTIALELPYESAVTVWKSTEQAGDRRKGAQY